MPLATCHTADVLHSYAQLSRNSFVKGLVLRIAAVVPSLVYVIPGSIGGQQSLLPGSASGRLCWLVFNSFRYDLRQPVENLVAAVTAHSIARMDCLARLANETAVALEINRKLLLFRYSLQALQFVRNLAAPKKRLEYEGIAIGHDLGDFFLDQAAKFRFVDPAARSNHFCW